jgi:tRNA(Arg) A34 adenosine deaminase TadA
MDKADQIFMQQAQEQAQKALAIDEVPIGAVLVERATGRVVARGYNVTRLKCDPTAHAEMEVIREGCRQFKAQRIPECDLYVTLEPCPQCAAAISAARIGRVVYGAADAKSGGAFLWGMPQLHWKPVIKGGVMADELGRMLTDYFKSKRQAREG